MAKKKVKKNMVKELKWVFPNKEFLILKFEALVIGIIAAFIFLLSIYNFATIYPAILLVILFIAIYVFVSGVIQKIRQAKEKYSITSTHLKVHRKTRFSSKKVSVPLKSVQLHKLDKVFRFGHVVDQKGKRFGLFFNNKEELNNFEKMLKKALKKR